MFAPHAPWRAAVVAYGRDASAARPASPAPPKKKGKKRKRGGTAPVADPAPSGARTSLGAGIVPPVGARIDWASLLRRVYLVDILACPCGGRRSVVADINDPTVVAAILTHLGLPTEAPPLARARSPSLEAA